MTVPRSALETRVLPFPPALRWLLTRVGGQLLAWLVSVPCVSRLLLFFARLRCLLPEASLELQGERALSAVLPQGPTGALAQPSPHCLQTIHPGLCPSLQTLTEQHDRH